MYLINYEKLRHSVFPTCRIADAVCTSSMQVLSAVRVLCHMHVASAAIRSLPSAPEVNGHMGRMSAWYQMPHLTCFELAMHAQTA